MSVLAEICREKLEYVNRTRHFIPDVVMEQRALQRNPSRGFMRAILSAKNAGRPALIAEVKKASPSKGIIRADFDPRHIAKEYESGGATCLSILTDQPYFKGSDEDFEAARSSVKIPALRKDFMLVPFQIIESRALGADCILIIMAALNDDTARALYAKATELGMDALFEIHDAEELDRALSLDPQMIGVNSRNLKNLQVNLDTAYGLLSRIPNDIIKVAESGIDGREELDRLHQAGFDAFLVGESLMRQDRIHAAVQKLLGTFSESG